MGKRTNGVYTLLPMDLALLEILPDEGQMLGFNPIALNVKAIKQRPEFENETGNQIGGRLRSMEFHELTCTQPILPTGKGWGWQRTAKGTAALRKAGRGVVVA